MAQVLIDRELLERAVKADASRGASSIALVDGWKAMEQIRAILANPTQQGEVVEVVAWRMWNGKTWRFCYSSDHAKNGWEPLYTTPQPGPDVRALLSADDVRDACANAVSVFAEETNASQCREVAEYMREVLLAQVARRQAQPQ